MDSFNPTATYRNYLHLDYKKHFSVKKKIILTIIFAIWFILVLSAGNGSSSEDADTPVIENESTEENPDAKLPSIDSNISDTSNEEEADIENVDETENIPDKSLTLGQQNALDKADDYLAFTSFSYSGLIDQLEFEGFTTEEATFAADNCGADWNEQASKKALDYLNYSAFSKTGLIEQLEFEGFTNDEATQAVENCGANWNEQAAKKAQDYLDYSSFSRDSLIDQLEFEGFTAEEAEYGVSAVGY